MRAATRLLAASLSAAAGLMAFAIPAGASPPAATSLSLYVALFTSNAVSIYSGLNGRTPVGQITQGVHGPQALAVDQLGTLYVANNDNTVTAYPQGATAPSATYTQGINQPLFLAVGPDGSLYVSNPAERTVVQFQPASTTPSRSIGFATSPGGIALDRQGNLYVVVGTDIEEFPPGSTTGTFLGFSLQFSPGALGFDAQGNVAVLQSEQGLSIFARQPPHTQLNSFGFPLETPTGFAFGNDGTSLYTSDALKYRVVRIAYPQGNFANVIDGAFGTSGAVAVSPPLAR